MPTVERAGATLHYEVIDIVAPWIEPAPTLLFHHGVSTTSGIWSEWLPILADRWRIVRFDMRGFGRSSRPEPGFAWSFETLVADALAVADAAGAERFHFVGESAGGTVGLALALSHPGRLATLTLCNAAHRGTAIRNVRGVWRERIEAEGQAAWADHMMRERFHPGALTADKDAWFRREQATCSPEATLAIAELLLRTDLSPGIPGIRAPTLLLSPDGSPFVAAGMMAELRDALPDAELQVFAHARHGLPFSHARECAAALRSFLERRG